MQTETRFIARYAETDQMGIVHHSNYPIWFEAGRTDFFKNLGISNSEIEAKGVILPLNHIECNFKNPAKYEDGIIVKTKIKRFTCARIEFIYDVVNEKDGKVLAFGSTSHAFTDKALKPLNVEKKLPELFRILNKINEN